MTDPTKQLPPVSPLASALDAPLGGTAQAGPELPYPVPDGMTLEMMQSLPVYQGQWRESGKFVCRNCGRPAFYHPHTNEIWGCRQCGFTTAAVALSFVKAAENTEQPPPPAKFLILSRHLVGDALLWWRPNAKGYTYNAAAAGRFDVSEARIHCFGTHGDHIAIPEADAMAACVPVLMFDEAKSLRHKFDVLNSTQAVFQEAGR